MQVIVKACLSLCGNENDKRLAPEKTVVATCTCIKHINFVHIIWTPLSPGESVALSVNSFVSADKLGKHSCVCCIHNLHLMSTVCGGTNTWWHKITKSVIRLHVQYVKGSHTGYMCLWLFAVYWCVVGVYQSFFQLFTQGGQSQYI